MSFDGTTSTDPDGDTLTYAWDLDGDGQYDDSTSATPSQAVPGGTYNVGLRVDDGHGHTSTATQQIQAGNTAPVLGTVTPSASLTWAVGQTVGFSATATDPQQGTMPASAFTWNLAIRHCPGGVCHTHNLSTFAGVASGSFQAPDHEYPSHLLLTVTVTDSGGLTDSQTVQLNPKTRRLSLRELADRRDGDGQRREPPDAVQRDLHPGLAGHRHRGADDGLRREHRDVRVWSDGGARSHELSAPTTATTYTATYTLASPSPAPTATLTIRTKSKKLEVTVAGEDRKDGWSGRFVVGSTVRVVARKHRCTRASATSSCAGATTAPASTTSSSGTRR